MRPLIQRRILGRMQRPHRRGPTRVRGTLRATAAIACLVAARTASAHHPGAGLPESLEWTGDPSIVVPLLVSAALFTVGWTRLRARTRGGANRLRTRALLFGAGWFVLAAAIVSPLHAAGEHSFAAHMVEHELIMLLAAPLLVMAEPLVVLLWAFPAGARRAIGALVASNAVASTWKRATGPVATTVLLAAALWLWHAPQLFDRALAGDGWHAAQHASFLVTALLFWRAMLRRRADPAADHGARVVAALCLFATSIVSGALGALMAFSHSPWYAGYARLGMAPFGLTAAEDQQLAGLIMWIPGGLVHALAALALVRTLLQPRDASANGKPSGAVADAV